LETLVALANVLDASVDELLTGSLAHRSRLYTDQLPGKKKTALQEILRTVEEALSTWSNEE
jgi:hypothetical protein